MPEMRLIATMPVRNEDWVIGLSIRAALRWCDGMAVLNHASTDRTAEILEEIQRETGRLNIIHEPSPEWNEMNHRQRLLEQARTMGATHVAIVDADEVLTGNLLPLIRDYVGQMPPSACLQIPMRNMYGGIDQFRSDASCWGRAITTVAFGDFPLLTWAATNGYQHHHREPHRSRIAARIYPQQMDGGVMHLQFASRRRLLAKHALYKIDEVIRWPNRRPVFAIDHEYSMAPDWTGATLAPAPDKWWEPYRDILHHLRLDAEPWQESRVREMVAHYGAARFEGLNLFGVA